MTHELLDELIGAFERDADDWDSLRSIFLTHARGAFLADFVNSELEAAAHDNDHIVRRGVGQSSFTFINSPDLEYSVRVITPFERKSRTVKWLGTPQVIAVKGRGSLTVRTLAVPREYNIEQFVGGVELTERSARVVHNGDVVVSEDPHEIIDICAATGPMVAEMLTYRRGAPRVIWTFTPELLSLYCEQSSLAASRFRNVLQIAHAAAVAVPDDIYELALASGSPQLVLPAVQSMIASNHPEGFAALHRAAESDQPEVRMGASAVLDSLFSARG